MPLKELSGRDALLSEVAFTGDDSVSSKHLTSSASQATSDDPDDASSSHKSSSVTTVTVEHNNRSSTSSQHRESSSFLPILRLNGVKSSCCDSSVGSISHDGINYTNNANSNNNNFMMKNLEAKVNVLQEEIERMRERLKNHDDLMEEHRVAQEKIEELEQVVVQKNFDMAEYRSEGDWLKLELKRVTEQNKYLKTTLETISPGAIVKTEEQQQRQQQPPEQPQISTISRLFQGNGATTKSVSSTLSSSSFAESTGKCRSVLSEKSNKLKSIISERMIFKNPLNHKSSREDGDGTVVSSNTSEILWRQRAEGYSSRHSTPSRNLSSSQHVMNLSLSSHKISWKDADDDDLRPHIVADSLYIDRTEELIKDARRRRNSYVSTNVVHRRPDLSSENSVRTIPIS